ncbi:MAG: hypothetical protein AAFR61_19430 [Bacteroidota bacterium]
MPHLHHIFTLFFLLLILSLYSCKKEDSSPVPNPEIYDNNDLVVGHTIQFGEHEFEVISHERYSYWLLTNPKEVASTFNDSVSISPGAELFDHGKTYVFPKTPEGSTQSVDYWTLVPADFIFRGNREELIEPMVGEFDQLAPEDTVTNRFSLVKISMEADSTRMNVLVFSKEDYFIRMYGQGSFPKDSRYFGIGGGAGLFSVSYGLMFNHGIDVVGGSFPK